MFAANWSESSKIIIFKIHPRFGEAPRAYIVVRPGLKLTEAEVKKFVDDNTTSYKHLVGGVEFIDLIPKSASGKILRRELRDKFMAELKNAAAARAKA
jgi:acyl-coenzyme A synthetase/AMP-(fatty) acid ligase